jgi:hypothetical protein
MNEVKMIEELGRIAFELRLVTWALVAFTVALVFIDEREHRRRG